MYIFQGKWYKCEHCTQLYPTIKARSKHYQKCKSRIRISDVRNIPAEYSDLTQIPQRLTPPPSVSSSNSPMHPSFESKDILKCHSCSFTCGNQDLLNRHYETASHQEQKNLNGKLTMP